MMKENSPIGVEVRPARTASGSGVPISVIPEVTASGLATRVKPATPKISHPSRQRSRPSICIPMATKKTALKTSRIPSNVRST